LSLVETVFEGLMILRGANNTYIFETSFEVGKDIRKWKAYVLWDKKESHPSS